MERSELGDELADAGRALEAFAAGPARAAADEIERSGGGLVRAWTVSEGAAVYDAAAMSADFPGGGSAVVGVGQLGFDGEPGAEAEVALTIPAP